MQTEPVASASSARAPRGRHPALSLDSAPRGRLRVRLRPPAPVLRRPPEPARRLGATRSRARRRFPRDRARVAAILAAQQERAARPAGGARGGGPAGRTRHRRHRHRPAGRAVRRPALHAAEGDHRHQAGRARHAATTACRPSRSSGSSPRTTTGRRSARARCSTPRCAGGRSRWARRPAPARARSRRRAPRPVGDGRRRRPARDAAGHRVHRRGAAERSPKPTGPASGCPTHSDAGSSRCWADSASSSTTRPSPTTKPLAGGALRPRARVAGDGHAAGVGAGRGARRRPATTRRSSRTPTTSRCSSWTASARRCTSARAPSSSATPPSCRPPTLVEEARQHPERFSPNVLLRPVVQDTLFPTVCYVAGPNELAYLAQLKPIYERFGVPEPLMVPRATATLLDSAAREVPREVRACRSRRCSRTTRRRSTTCWRTSCRSPSRRRSQDVSRAVEGGMATPDRRRAADRPDARRRGALVARPDAARPAHAAREDHPRGQAARRDAAAAVRADARAGVPRRPSAGTQHRLRVLPEPLRPGARRSAARRPAARPRARTGC